MILLFRVAHGLELCVVAGQGELEGAALGRRVGLAALARARVRARGRRRQGAVQGLAAAPAVLQRVHLAGARTLALDALK